MGSFKDEIENMRIERGMPPIEERVMVRLPDAGQKLKEALGWYFGRIGVEYRPMRELPMIESWLTDNHGKGLFLYGNHGRGKTVLAKYVIPSILLYYCRRPSVYCPSTELLGRLKEVMASKVVIIDDIGAEGYANDYGVKRTLVDEVVDDAEQRSKLLIVTSNLSKELIIEKYGEGVFDRLTALTVRVPFVGESYRQA